VTLKERVILMSNAANISACAKPGSVKVIATSIASGQSLSGEINIGGYSTVEIQMPSSWDAANFTFQSSNASGGTYQNMYDDAGTEVTVNAVASRNMTTTKLQGAVYIKIRSGTSSTAVNQTAARTITLVLKK
jgi:hypothetical protein